MNKIGYSFIFAVAAIMLTMTVVPAFAARDGHGTPRTEYGSPTDPSCWGEVNSELAQVEDGQAGLGHHASDPVPFVEGRETPRNGVGNQAEDTPSEHGATVSEIDGIDETSCE
jgi:hypothetical protein